MKKLFKILILFALALTLFACNKKNNPTDNTNKVEEKEKNHSKRNRIRQNAN